MLTSTSIYDNWHRQAYMWFVYRISNSIELWRKAQRQLNENEKEIVLLCHTHTHTVLIFFLFLLYFLLDRKWESRYVACGLHESKLMNIYALDVGGTGTVYLISSKHMRKKIMCSKLNDASESFSVEYWHFLYSVRFIWNDKPQIDYIVSHLPLFDSKFGFARVDTGIYIMCGYLLVPNKSGHAC